MIIRNRPHEAPPVPVSAGGRRSPLGLALLGLMVGGFVFVPTAERPPKRTAASASRFGRLLGRRFTCRTITYEKVEGCGIWRLPDPPDVDGEREVAVTHEAVRCRAAIGVPQLQVAERR